MSKTRSRRRDAGKERHWREVIRAQGVSGRSVRAYCRGAGVKESAFYWWRRELARRDAGRESDRRNTGNAASHDAASRNGAPRNGSAHRRSPPSGAASARKTSARPSDSDSPRFLPVRVAADGPAGGARVSAVVDIHLGDGRMVRVGPGVARRTLIEVLAALEDSSC